MSEIASPDSATNSEPAIPPYRLPAQARGEAVRVLLQGLLDRVVADLSAESPAAERAHAARKRLKRARGLLRAVRQTDPAFFKTENARLRDIARLLAPIRETGAEFETIDAVETDYADVLVAGAFATVREGLADNAPAAATPEHLQATLDSAIANAHLGSAGLYHLSWPEGDDEPEALADSLARLVKDGRKAGATLDKGQTPDTLHSLRKALKNLWLAEKLYRDLLPGDVFPARKAMRAAIETLGAIHDIDDLTPRLAAEMPGTPPARDALIALLAARRTRLLAVLDDQRAALGLPKPGKVGKLVRKALRAADQADGAAAQ